MCSITYYYCWQIKALMYNTFFFAKENSVVGIFVHREFKLGSNATRLNFWTVIEKASAPSLVSPLRLALGIYTDRSCKIR